MTLKRYLLIMAVFTAVCLICLSFVIFSAVNPEKTNWAGFLLFYLSLFLSMSGVAAIFGFFVRFVLLKHELVFRSVYEAFRQSFLFSLLITISFLLLSKGMFSWMNLILLVVGLSVMEFFLISHQA